MFPPHLLPDIVQKIHRQFPEVAGVQPKIRRQAAQNSASQPASETFLLTFQANAHSGGQTIPRTVRVVVAANGKILKISTSR